MQMDHLCPYRPVVNGEHHRLAARHAEQRLGGGAAGCAIHEPRLVRVDTCQIELAIRPRFRAAFDDHLRAVGILQAHGCRQQPVFRNGANRRQGRASDGLLGGAKHDKWHTATQLGHDGTHGGSLVRHVDQQVVAAARRKRQGGAQWLETVRRLAIDRDNVRPHAIKTQLHDPGIAGRDQPEANPRALRHRNALWRRAAIDRDPASQPSSGCM